MYVHIFNTHINPKATPSHIQLPWCKQLRRLKLGLRVGEVGSFRFAQIAEAKVPSRRPTRSRLSLPGVEASVQLIATHRDCSNSKRFFGFF